MKACVGRLAWGISLFLLVGSASTSQVQERTIGETDWPRMIANEKGILKLYQPQLETFEGVRLTCRSAFSVLPTGVEEPIFGAVWFEARMDVDRSARTVRIEEIAVTDAKFPEADEEKVGALSELLTDAITRWDPLISLDRILTQLELLELQRKEGSGLKNDPPRIVVVDHPAVLVNLDGPPQLQAIEGSNVMEVVNTPFLMLFDPGSKAYYLTDGRLWLTSVEVAGPWKEVEDPPAAVRAIFQGEEDSAAELDETDGTRPEIIVATEPTELIATDGEPTWTPLDSTGLLFLTNTDSDVFLELESQRTYVLLSGRWYVASSLGADDWAFVEPTDLPAAFAAIPPESPKADVRASVAGTDEALDAVHETFIPQTAAIDREKARLEVTYDGDPEFELIDGTEMMYAVNTSYEVVRVGDLYYCCNQAVWFVATSPRGPWTICTEVPQVIYTIPASSPVYEVTYVYVYDSSPSVVYVGYLPGYVGCHYYRGVVVYGTGWIYRPWYRRYYYARPVTWGYGFRYSHHSGAWGVRIGYRGYYGGVAVGYRGGWWGCGGRRYGDIDVDTTVKTPFGTWKRSTDVEVRPGDIDVDRKISFTPNENLYDRRENRDRNRPPRERPGLDPGRRPEGGSRRTPPVAGVPERGGSRRDDLYADRAGNVHRRTDEGWQSRESKGWSQPRSAPGEARVPNRTPIQPTRPSTRPSTQPQPGRTPGYSGLDAHRQARERGSRRTYDYRARSQGHAASRPSFRGGRRGR